MMHAYSSLNCLLCGYSTIIAFNRTANTNVETTQPSETLLANTNIDISDATNKTVPSPKLSPLVPDKRYNQDSR